MLTLRRDAAAVTLLRTAGLNQRLQRCFEEGDAVEDDVTCCIGCVPRNATRPRPPYKNAVIALARLELCCATTIVSLQPVAPSPGCCCRRRRRRRRRRRFRHWQTQPLMLS